MTYLLKTKTDHAYVVKILVELLQNNMKTACFEADDQGLSLRMMDSEKRFLIDLQLDRDKFNEYRFQGEKLYMGINLSHFHKMLKTIKKKDMLFLTITADQPNNLKIRVKDREGSRLSDSTIKIQNLQNLMIDLPGPYPHSVIVPSSDFQKSLKDLEKISPTVNVTSRGFSVCFSGDAGQIYSRNVTFGEIDSDVSDEEDDDVVYSRDFDIERFVRITKLSGLDTTLRVYPAEGLPLLIRSNVGDLGLISIYIKSKDQIEEDMVPIDDE